MPTEVLDRVQRLAELTGLPFLCVETASGRVVWRSERELLPLVPPEIRQRLAEVTSVSVSELASGLLYYALPLPTSGAVDERCVAVGYVLSRPGIRPPDLVLCAAEENWSQSRLDDWLARRPHCHAAQLESLLALAGRSLDQEQDVSALQREIAGLGQQIDHTYEEITLLHNLTRNLQISRSPVEVAEVCLARLHGLVQAEGNLILVDRKEPDTEPHLLVEGVVPFDQAGFARLAARFETHDFARPLVKNGIQGSLLGADFPGLRSLVLVPIGETSRRLGWIAAFNVAPGREFGTVEANLLNSVASILGTHVRNIELYEQHDDLLLSFVRSLVSTLDAKDPYTRGHSERVALIARRLADELGLPRDDVDAIYVSGLLHDIGKIGIDDRILQKPGDLTREEFAEVQRHPMIGYDILKGLKNLRHILPGVRNHHESWNGKGYPDGLAGEDIPLMARIIAVADSFDAMGSDRPYRQGMPIEQLEAIFRRGAGQQWDPRIVEAYFRIRQDVFRLCAEYAPDARDLLAESRVRANAS